MSNPSPENIRKRAALEEVRGNHGEAFDLRELAKNIERGVYSEGKELVQ